MSTVRNNPFDAPRVLRSLARAFGRFENFEGFVGAVESALSLSGGFGRLRLDLDGPGPDEAERFAPHRLTLPLSTESGALGAMQLVEAGERRLFGVEDLHLLAGLADLVGAVLSQARRARESIRARELLALLLDQAPVGIAAYAEDFSPIVANRAAARWLGNARPPFTEPGGESAFHLRAEGALLHGEVRKTAAGDGSVWIVVLHDLGPEQGRFMDTMQRDLYRALATQEPFGIALIDAPAGGALRRLGALRGLLEGRERAGPYDATRAAVVLGAKGPALRARLRRLRTIFDADAGLRLGYAELGRDGAEPEALLKGAVEGCDDFDARMRRTLLVHGESAAVADSLALALGREFRVVRSESEAEARDRLLGGEVDAFLTELDPWGGAGEEASPAAFAQELAPGIPVLFTTIAAGGGRTAGKGATVIEKPFEIEAVVSACRRAVPC